MTTVYSLSGPPERSSTPEGPLSGKSIAKPPLTDAAPHQRKFAPTVGCVEFRARENAAVARNPQRRAPGRWAGGVAVWTNRGVVMLPVAVHSPVGRS